VAALEVPGGTSSLRLARWRDGAVVAVAVVAAAAGFGQFGAVAALGTVASHFGHLTGGATLRDQAGLSGTELGVGLAILRLASLAGLPLAGAADRLGRRRTLLWCCAIGLAFTVAAAASPSYWWFVAIFAAGRPLLSATNAVAQVSCAELTSTRDRAKAVALVAAGYGVGAGVIAIVHGLASSALGFRGIFLLAVVPLMLMPWYGRFVVETDRFVASEAAKTHPIPVLGPIGASFRRRLGVVLALTFAVSIVTGPATSFFFLYAENVVGLSGPVVALLVATAGLTGLAGLLGGRWLADHLGRRPTAAGSMVLIAVVAMVTYSGSRLAAALGYLAAVGAASTFAPAAGALSNELFPTAVRASVAGWQIAAGVLGATAGLLAFGAVADTGGRFALASVVVFAVVIPAAGLFAFLPETKGKELEELWGTPESGP